MIYLSILIRSYDQALTRLGLRVVLDVVYNHLYGNGPHDRYSVLDKVGNIIYMNTWLMLIERIVYII